MPDREHPYNNLPTLPPSIDWEDRDFLKLTIDAQAAVAKLNTLTDRRAAVAIGSHMLSPLFIPEAVASSAVEQVMTTNKKVLEAFTKPSKEIGDAEKEVMNYQHALVMGMRAIAQNDSNLLAKEIDQTQERLLPAKKGRRTSPGYQITNAKTGYVYYTPPDIPSVVDNLMSDLEKFMNEEAETHTVFVRMAIMHYQFEAIHPYKDGNGRTGRILMPLYLYRQRALDIPLLFISSYILNHRDEYNKLIRGVTYKSDWKPWIVFILKALVEQAEYTANVLSTVLRKMDGTQEKIAPLMRSADVVRVVEYIFGNTTMTVKDFQKGVDVSYASARKYLGILTDAEVLTRIKVGRTHVYFAPDLWTILKAMK